MTTPTRKQAEMPKPSDALACTCDEINGDLVAFLTDPCERHGNVSRAEVVDLLGELRARVEKQEQRLVGLQKLVDDRIPLPVGDPVSPVHVIGVLSKLLGDLVQVADGRAVVHVDHESSSAADKSQDATAAAEVAWAEQLKKSTEAITEQVATLRLLNGRLDQVASLLASGPERIGRELHAQASRRKR